MSRKVAAIVGLVGLSACSAEIIDSAYGPYTVRLWGPDSAQVAPGSANDPFAATKSYKVTVRFFEDAQANVPYGSKLSPKPDLFAAFNPVQTFTVDGARATFRLGDADIALPQVSSGGSIYVSTEVLGFGDDAATPIGRARCPVQELKPVNTGGKDVACVAFYGLVGRWNPVKAPAVPRFSFAAGAFADGRVVIAGGNQTTAPGVPTQALAKVEVFEIGTAPDGSVGGVWRELGQLGQARHGPAFATAANDLIFVAGGIAKDGYSKAVDVIDGAGRGSVRPGSPLANPRALAAGAPFKADSIVIATGAVSEGSAASNAEQIVDKAASRLLAASSGARSNACLAAVTKDKLVLCGGGGAGGGPTSCESFDGSAFSPAGLLRQPRPDVKCVSTGGQVFLIGGSSDATYKDIEVWAQGVVQPFDPAPRSLVGHAAAVANGKVVVAGGMVPGTTDKLASGFWFDPKGGMHDLVGPGEMKTARAHHQLVGLPDGNVMAVGGQGMSAVPPGAEIFVVPD